MSSSFFRTPKATVLSCYSGLVTQAITNNFAPLLFLTFASSFGLTLEQITLLTTVNFAVQLLIDLLSARFVDRIGYRPCIVSAEAVSCLGLLGLAVLPSVLPDPYTGLMISVILYAVGGGLIEVLVSPIMESCPTENKEASMSLLHSFYCWGHVALVLFCTAFFACFGVARWRILACLLAVVPFLSMLSFTAVPLYPVGGGSEKLGFRGLLKSGIFWVLLLLMIAAGASEQAMSQWASAFAESGLHVSKTVGDLAGPCAFAVMMGTARALFGRFADRIRLRVFMTVSACLCVACYLLASLTAAPLPGLIGCALCGFSVGIFWPGTVSTAAAYLPGGGTAMYGLLALAGDVGCSAGPSFVGFIADANGGSLKSALLPAVIFPVLILLGLALLGGKKRGGSNTPHPEK